LKLKIVKNINFNNIQNRKKIYKKNLNKIYNIIYYIY